MALLSNEDREYLKGLFTGMKRNVNILLFTTEEKEFCTFCNDIKSILDELKSISDKIQIQEFSFENNKEEVAKYDVKRGPALVLMADKDLGVKFYGIPAGYEFSSLVEDIVDIGNDTISIDEGLIETVKAISKPVHIQVFVTHTCPYCPPAVRTAHKFAMANENIKADMIDSNTFFDYANKYGVQGVPRVVINEKHHFEGALPEEEYLRQILNSIL
ncbi:TPA: glutaredoxin [candidate division WOR-3 bacterium]|jgi:glutaredoxin-like protein|uniref:Glutaredoxin n=1 Tax=candidate division WOR-3 bacterium TaxID=2052148 RepID=A0A350HA16_UNCW3|nr:glutaredoxin [candidate division WOR-3 bacterium]